MLRTEKITQTELARRMGVSSVQVSKILSGKENIGLQTIAKIEKALDRSIVTFCGISEPRTADLSEATTGPVIQPYTYSVASNMYTGACEPEPNGYSDSLKE
ncbi:MAG: helix-turn-helix domain-containing protein [Muribaculaceae bacterium]|nr:helix-turn-helix domain-containing protein [Muribaculaceae bacterium]